jgi:hypothetical protein
MANTHFAQETRRRWDRLAVVDGAAAPALQLVVFASWSSRRVYFEKYTLWKI